jgi:long-chain acyl-CoA synthetase
VTSVDPIISQLFGPEGPFEIVIEPVLGIDLQVYKKRMSSLREVIESGAVRPDTDFLVQGDRRLNYAEHDLWVRSASVALANIGVEAGDRVAIVSANSIEWVAFFWACVGTGVVTVPLNAWWKTEELEFALDDSGTKVMLCDLKRWELVRELLPTLTALTHVFVIGLTEPDGIALPASDLFADSSAPAFSGPPPDEDDLAAILYTSGTTGKPKGATVTHRQVIGNLQNIMCASVVSMMRAGEAGAPSEYQAGSLLVVPLFHVTGCLATMVTSYATGGKLVLMPPGRFDADHAMATIEAERVSSIGGVPTIMWRIVDSENFSKYDLSSVTRISYGGAPAAPELVTRINECFPQAKSALTTAYGLTETASVATANAGADYLNHPDSCGRPVPTVEMRVVADDGKDAPLDGKGEVWLRGPTIMLRGYWNRPDANAEALTADGWFKTGDIGRIDAEGFLYLIDRAKDMIIRAGENIYCVEVENILFEHPDIIDAAIVGVPHKQMGEEVKAVVQRRPGSDVTVEEIRDFCRLHLADFKVPEYVDIIDDPLPRNPAGKVLKNILRGGASAFAPSESDDSAL